MLPAPSGAGPGAQAISVVGSLAARLDEWDRADLSPWVRRLVASGFRLLWGEERPTLTSVPPPFSMPANLEVRQALDGEVRTLLQKGAVERVRNTSSPGFYSRLFTVPKASGGLRPVLDLSPLNVYLRKVRFRMETVQNVRAAIRSRDWGASIDLKDAYFHVEIHPADRKWLRFVWDGEVFQFRVLPFGLSLSPWVFTRVVRELASLARAQGIRLRVYLDDWLILAASSRQCSQDTQEVLRLARMLGFVVNLEKSELRPSQTFVYLGMEIDTVAARVAPKLARLTKFKELLLSLSAASQASARQLASLLGMMESFHGLLPLARTHKRPLQRALLSRWTPAVQEWNLLIRLGPWFRRAVRKWSDEAWLSQDMPLVLPPVSTEIFTDASLQGWGAHLGSRCVQGVWSRDQATLHINILEALAVELALHALESDLQGPLVSVVSDNTSVVAYLNREGGTHSPSLSEIAERAHLFCHQRGAFLRARHLAGVANVLADQLSRASSSLPTEWTLVPRILQPIWDRWYKPRVDLFATKFSRRLPRYVSPVPDPGAWAVDAFSFPWTGLSLYMFPPFAVLPQVLRKIELDEAEAILIAPLWPARPWFPDLLRLKREGPVDLGLAVGDLVQPRSGVPHPRPESFHLHAWLL